MRAARSLLEEPILQPPGSRHLGPVQAILNVPLAQLCDATIRAHRRMYVTGWTFAILASRMRREEGWKLDNAPSFADWGRTTLRMEYVTLHKYARIGDFLLGLPIDQQDAWIHVPVTNALEVLPQAKRNAREALALCQEKTQPQLRALVKYERDEKRAAKIRVTFNVEAETLKAWQHAFWLLKAHCAIGDSKYPSDDAVLTAMAQTVLQAPELTHGISDELMADIAAGKVHCVICRGYSQLEKHHILLRSKGGTEGPTCYLCRTCHDRVHRRLHGWSWRRLAEHCGYPDIAKKNAKVELRI